MPRPRNIKIILLLLILGSIEFAHLTAPVPHYAAIFCERGLTAQSKGQINQAVADYQKAIFHNPFDPESYYRIGLLYQKQGDEQKALKNFYKVVELGEKKIYAPAYLTVGMDYLKQGQQTKALACFQELQLPEAIFYRGVIYYNLGQKDLAYQQMKILHYMVSIDGIWKKKLGELLYMTYPPR